MSNGSRLIGFLAAAIVASGVATLALRAEDKKPAASAANTRYFELRTYHAAPGKLNALNARFRDHTMQLFKKHGMESIGYWTPAEDQGERDANAPKTPEANGSTLVYILAYPSKEACDASWKAFREDPEWVKAKAESEKDGPLVEKVDHVFLNPTDYSPMK